MGGEKDWARDPANLQYQCQCKVQVQVAREGAGTRARTRGQGWKGCAATFSRPEIRSSPFLLSLSPSFYYRPTQNYARLSSILKIIILCNAATADDDDDDDSKNQNDQMMFRHPQVQCHSPLQLPPNTILKLVQPPILHNSHVHIERTQKYLHPHSLQCQSANATVAINNKPAEERWVAMWIGLERGGAKTWTTLNTNTIDLPITDHKHQVD